MPTHGIAGTKAHIQRLGLDMGRERESAQGGTGDHGNGKQINGAGYITSS